MKNDIEGILVGSRLRIDEEYHSIELGKNELSQVLEDIAGIEDLLEPEVKIEGNIVHFRSEDLKVMNPELFFKRTGVKVSLREYFKQTSVMQFNILALVCLIALAYITSIHFGTDLTWITAVIVLIAGNGFAMAVRQSNEIERQRKATYVKATLVMIFYVLVMDDMTNTNSRISRSLDKLEKEHYELHDDLDKIVNGLPNEYKMKFKHLIDHNGKSVVRSNKVDERPIKYS